jgi:hypothetical protein
MTGDTLRLLVTNRAALTVQLGSGSVGSNPPRRGMVFRGLHLMAAQAVVAVLRSMAQIAFLVDFGLRQFPSVVGIPE